MKKRLICWLCVALLLTAMPISAFAVTPVDVEHPCSLTLLYSQESQAFSDLHIQLYRVAEIFPDSTYALCGDFADYPVNIYGITSQAEWRQVTSTLASYVAADQLQPTATARTDESGAAYFGDLRTGMYLILAVRVETEQTVYLFEDFLVSIPSPQENGDYLYDVTAKPKCSSYTPEPENATYKVLKLWKDTGYEQSRPDSVQVDIFKNGEFWATETLSDHNNWCVSWSAPEDGSLWQAVERDVAEHYKVTIVAEGNTILITNTRKSEPTPPPQTGDSFSLWPVMMTTCISGLTLLMIGVRRKRTENEET